MNTLGPSEGEIPKSKNLLSRVGRLLGFSPIPADVAEEMSALRAKVAELTHAQLENQNRVTSLRETVERLEKQIARAGKEQFKANALAEAQQQSLTSMLEQLREAEAYRERELANLRERLATARAEGRMDVIKRLLPALDGLGEALAAGENLLTGQKASPPAPRETEPRPLSFGQRLIGAWALLSGAALKREPSQEPEALATWLKGLEFVQERLLETLAAEGVHPIETEGERFDPHLHITVEAVPAADGVEPGTIVSETRRGYYRTGESVLRYAEVVVAR